MTFATVIALGLQPYRISQEDKLWAARAAQFEGHDPADTLWTWTQRHTLPAFRRRYPQLHELIKAHSQPVNPIWRRTGSKCRPGGSYHGTDHCSEGRLQRRDQAASLSFSQTRPDVQAAVQAWAEGRLPNPVDKAVDFAAPGVAQSFMRRNPGSRLVKQAGNWFIATSESLRWPSGRVRMQPASGVQRILPARSGKPGAWIVPALVLGSAGTLMATLFYVAWKRRPGRSR